MFYAFGSGSRIKLQIGLPDTLIRFRLVSRVDIATRGTAMRTPKQKDIFRGLPKKTYWHLYSLQNLQSEKLARIVNKILKKEYVLIK
jgi:hypothetical protein